MPNDAKCGLVVGVGLVIAVAIVFFQRDSSSEPPVAIDPPAHAAQPPANGNPAEPAALPEETSSQTGAVEGRTLIHQPAPEQGASPAIPAIHSPTRSPSDPWKPVK